MTVTPPTLSAPAQAAQAGQPEPAYSWRQWLEDAPSWLVSMVTHLAFVLILALFVVESQSGGSNGFSMNAEIGGSSGGSGDAESMEEAMAKSLEQTSTLQSEVVQQAVAPTQVVPDMFADPVAELPKLDIGDLAMAMSSSKAQDEVLGGRGDDPNSKGGFGTGEGGLDGDKVGPGAGEGDGPGSSTSLFDLRSEGHRFVYVFDRSESMNSILQYMTEGTVSFSISPLQAAKRELIRSLNDLNTASSFQLIFYNHEHVVYQPSRKAQMIKATKSSIYAATKFVEEMPGTGNTYHLEPLQVAINLRPDVIYLMTDGEEKDDPTEYQLAQLKRLNAGRAKIYVIQFCMDAAPRSSLVKLAEDNGGKHVFINISQLAPKLPGNPDAPPVEVIPPAANRMMKTP